MKILLDKIMGERNLTINQVSILTDLPHSTILDIKNGRSSPRMNTIEKLAKGLKMRISDLYDSQYK